MKSLIYTTVAITLICGLFQNCNTSVASSKSAILINRQDTIGKSAEWQNIQQLFTNYNETIAKDSNDIATQLKLIALYLNEARVSGNQEHYYRLAMKLLNKITSKKDLREDYLYEALSYKSSILLSLHQFSAAEKMALAALAINNTEADIYGALIDANVELGNYQKAVSYCDIMLGIRPDLRSYSRASYLRQIHGDNFGAIEAMKMAVQAGAVGMENTEWARVNLGELYLNIGALDTAQLMFETALANRPNYPHASMGLAKLAKIKMQYDTAIMHCENAIGTISESSFVSFLASIYVAKGNQKKADEINKDVLKLLIAVEKENETEMLIKHNGNRELASAYFANGMYSDALAYAIKDVTLRPNNIDACELLANIYSKLNDHKNAIFYAQKALVTNSKNATTLKNLSEIYIDGGKPEIAKELETTYKNLTKRNNTF